MAEETTDALLQLAKEQKEFEKDAEIDRILRAFRLDAYAVLDLQPGVPESDIKAHYRKKSLFVHPDKTKNPKAPDAFDRLAKAHQTLLDDKQRQRLDEAIGDARSVLMRERKWTADSEEVRDESFLELWRDKAKYVLMDYEKDRFRREKAMMREQGREERKAEEELTALKRKREHDKNWEKTRDERIGSWRDFADKQAAAKRGEGSKKKKKLKVLG
ncbi:DnaJ-domain-containing protein [Aulographum hederae CBS 113979]|uniref:DnaJ-domain-containing protein n=1 Tax=Aulographum hederae CBS 113979 TaxID=1176131 RepID=A0A6G1H7X9_9PEZI|nr:DnaJ-domain-containing protein [Aulographum hederae CBS 113979]